MGYVMLVYVNVNYYQLLYSYMNTKTWTISELSNEFNLTPRTLRYYELHGIVSPTRNGMQRIYHVRDRARLIMALRAKRLGFSLADIRELLDTYDGPGSTPTQLKHYQQLLDHYHDKLSAQLADLKKTLHDIEAQQERCKRLLKDECAD